MGDLPQLKQADVRAVPIAGWFYPDVANFSAWKRNASAGFDWNTTMKLARTWTDEGSPYSGWADESCKEALGLEAYKCGSIGVVYPYIKTPLFVLENQFDYEQIFGELKLPRPSKTMGPISKLEALAYIRYYGQRQRSSLRQIGSHDTNGLWAPACLDHAADFGLNSTKLLVNGIALRTAMLDWFETNGTGGPNVHMEACAEKGLGTPCSVPSGSCRKIPFLDEE